MLAYLIAYQAFPGKRKNPNDMEFYSEIQVLKLGFIFKLLNLHNQPTARLLIIGPDCIVLL